MRRKTIFVTVIRNILRMKRLGCILCMPHKWTRDSKYSRRRTEIKIFAPPFQIPIAWFSLITKFFDPLSSLPVNSTPHEIVFFYPMWLDNSIVLKYIYYNNVNFRHEMLTNLVYAHCFSLVFLNEKLFENATLRLSDVYRWMVRRNFQASHQLSPWFDYRSIIDPWSSNPILLGTFTFDFSIPFLTA